MLLHQILQNIPVVLGSQSPRRRELLASLQVDFEVVIPKVDESYDQHLSAPNIAEQIALKKLKAFADKQYLHKLIITSDTIVCTLDGQILGKPNSKEEAIATLKKLSGTQHYVYTAVAFAYQNKMNWFSECTTVTFDRLDDEMINYYVDSGKAYDKAGSYGIQEWIGRIAVSNMVGTYENVMGLPTNRLYIELLKFFSK